MKLKKAVNLKISFCIMLISNIIFAQNRISERQYVFNKESEVYIDYDSLNSSLRFTPTVDDLKRADSIFKSDLSPKIEYESYYRNYVGLKIRGDKMIFVNLNCKMNENFEKNLFQPKGGGRCYFRGLINIDKNITEKFTINAPK
ncbi:hypothetical protein [Kaistella montana]|uniref:GLPGLI family protein n=1 Tax=Kaistella montana TaxID=1849733 RepID=A0ABW5KAE2_9FLAO|nr:hypothetical protein [Kaistella montana]MCQ4035645.1 hypothetical protein [Kaistella montana]